MSSRQRTQPVYPWRRARNHGYPVILPISQQPRNYAAADAARPAGNYALLPSTVGFAVVRVGTLLHKRCAPCGPCEIPQRRWLFPNVVRFSALCLFSRKALIWEQRAGYSIGENPEQPADNPAHVARSATSVAAGDLLPLRACAQART